jgi:hypothetical protein
VSSLLAATIFFLGIHFFISGTALRGKIVGLIGEGPFRSARLAGGVRFWRSFSTVCFFTFTKSFSASRRCRRKQDSKMNASISSGFYVLPPPLGSS